MGVPIARPSRSRPHEPSWLLAKRLHAGVAVLRVDLAAVRVLEQVHRDARQDAGPVDRRHVRVRSSDFLQPNPSLVRDLRWHEDVRVSPLPTDHPFVVVVAGATLRADSLVAEKRKVVLLNAERRGVSAVVVTLAEPRASPHRLVEALQRLAQDLRVGTAGVHDPELPLVDRLGLRLGLRDDDHLDHRRVLDHGELDLRVRLDLRRRSRGGLLEGQPLRPIHAASGEKGAKGERKSLTYAHTEHATPFLFFCQPDGG